MVAISRSLLLAVLLATPATAFVLLSAHSTRRQVITLQACADEKADSADETADTSGLYASLQQRASQLAARDKVVEKEKKLVASLADAWPSSELAQNQLWQHWYGEEGEDAREAIVSADESGDTAALELLSRRYPDWAEPLNRLATMRYIQGEYKASVDLCLDVLRLKP